MGKAVNFTIAEVSCKKVRVYSTAAREHQGLPLDPLLTAVKFLD